MNGDGGSSGGGIDLGSSDSPGSPMMGGGGGGDGGPSYPGLSMSSDNPDMDNAPEEGEATVKFHKHSHTKERHPTKAGKHVHHVHLKVHSIKFHKPTKKKVSKEDLAAALSAAGPPGGADDEGSPPPGGAPGPGGPGGPPPGGM
jgi:hypothetical protein